MKRLKEDTYLILFMRQRWQDRMAELSIIASLICMGVGSAYAQILPFSSSASQDTINGAVGAILISHGDRISHLETALNWAAGALIANLIAHLFQISVQLRKREDDNRIITK